MNIEQRISNFEVNNKKYFLIHYSLLVIIHFVHEIAALSSIFIGSRKINELIRLEDLKKYSEFKLFNLDYT